MDFAESSRIVFTRIKKLEPENVSKIIGYILLQEPCEQEMIQLAVCSDVSLQDVVFKAKAELHELALKSAPSPIPPPIHLPHVNEIPFQLAAAAPFPPVSAGVSFRGPSHYWDHQHHQQQQVLLNKNGSDFVPLGYSDSVKEFQSQQTQLFGLEEQMEQFSLGNLGFQNECYYPDAALSNLSGRANRGYNYLSEHPVKACHYFFNKGFCKHGSNCRYSHGLASEGYPQVYGHSSLDGGFIEDHVFSPGSLEKLELEIVELLKSRRGSPISIASLPMMYYEKYRKVLQADGYLTESQRHGKAGYSLTKLLARLKNSIRLIDRPHGQHAVILAEDASKYMDNRNERSDPGPIVSGSRQIYLTFPAESTFTEDDVSNYFSTYGPVEDVRIPCQQKRMFGFVTFASADTVKMILEKGNPHFVCGARVLVKPYREKSKLGDRKYHERMEHPVYFPPHYIDMEPELHPVARGYEDSRFFRKQVMPEHQLALELERRRLAELQFMRKPVANHHFYGPTYDNFKVPEDHLNFPLAERFGHLFDVLNNGSNADDRVKHAENNHNDQECEGLNLPDSPFATQRAGGISSVI